MRFELILVDERGAIIDGDQICGICDEKCLLMLREVQIIVKHFIILRFCKRRFLKLE